MTINKCDICSRLESKNVIIKEYSIYNRIISLIYETNVFDFKDLCNECADEIYKIEKYCKENIDKIIESRRENNG